MISCAEAVRRMWEFVERELEPTDQERIEEHLAFCRRCCGEVEFAEELRRLMARAARARIHPSVEARLNRFLGGLEGST